ncbi:hypothetical protein Aph02nite_39540 [Actinoplanes philippinensis]|nr:hypothetical protein Aph02nite_39540 [Actinoplanes philippinensis]
MAQERRRSPHLVAPERLLPANWWVRGQPPRRAPKPAKALPLAAGHPSAQPQPLAALGPKEAVAVRRLTKPVAAVEATELVVGLELSERVVRREPTGRAAPP